MIVCTDNQTVYITVTDDNDHPPSFNPTTYMFDMPEEIPVDGSVNYVQGVDNDIGDNAKLTFEVTGGRDAAHFYMDSIYVSKTGAIKIQQVTESIFYGDTIFRFCFTKSLCKKSSY